jgi:hypothetical protein
MNRTLGGGIAVTVLGLVGYAVGVWTPYPGRSFSVTAVMVGLTLVAIGRSGGPDEAGAGTSTAAGSRSASEQREGSP